MDNSNTSKQPRPPVYVPLHGTPLYQQRRLPVPIEGEIHECRFLQYFRILPETSKRMGGIGVGGLGVGGGGGWLGSGRNPTKEKCSTKMKQFLNYFHSFIQGHAAFRTLKGTVQQGGFNFIFFLNFFKWIQTENDGLKKWSGKSYKQKGM